MFKIIKQMFQFKVVSTPERCGSVFPQWGDVAGLIRALFEVSDADLPHACERLLEKIIQDFSPFIPQGTTFAQQVLRAKAAFQGVLLEDERDVSAQALSRAWLIPGAKANFMVRLLTFFKSCCFVCVGRDSQKSSKAYRYIANLEDLVKIETIRVAARQAEEAQQAAQEAERVRNVMQRIKAFEGIVLQCLEFGRLFHENILENVAVKAARLEFVAFLRALVAEKGMQPTSDSVIRLMDRLTEEGNPAQLSSDDQSGILIAFKRFFDVLQSVLEPMCFFDAVDDPARLPVALLADMNAQGNQAGAVSSYLAQTSALLDGIISNAADISARNALFISAVKALTAVLSRQSSVWIDTYIRDALTELLGADAPLLSEIVKLFESSVRRLNLLAQLQQDAKSVSYDALGNIWWDLNHVERISLRRCDPVFRRHFSHNISKLLEESLDAHGAVSVDRLRDRILDFNLEMDMAITESRAGYQAAWDSMSFWAHMAYYANRALYMAEDYLPGGYWGRQAVFLIFSPDTAHTNLRKAVEAVATGAGAACEISRLWAFGWTGMFFGLGTPVTRVLENQFFSDANPNLLSTRFLEVGFRAGVGTVISGGYGLYTGDSNIVRTLALASTGDVASQASMLAMGSYFSPSADSGVGVRGLHLVASMIVSDLVRNGATTMLGFISPKDSELGAETYCEEVGGRIYSDSLCITDLPSGRFLEARNVRFDLFGFHYSHSEKRYYDQKFFMGMEGDYSVPLDLIGSGGRIPVLSITESASFSFGKWPLGAPSAGSTAVMPICESPDCFSGDALRTIWRPAPVVRGHFFRHGESSPRICTLDGADILAVMPQYKIRAIEFIDMPFVVSRLEELAGSMPKDYGQAGTIMDHFGAVRYFLARKLLQDQFIDLFLDVPQLDFQHE